MNKKSHAAIEFLFTYGRAILIVLIAICVLLYFGVLDNINKCFCSNVDMIENSRITENNITYIECFNITRYLDYEKTKIMFNTTYKLFYCSMNKTLIPVNGMI